MSKEIFIFGAGGFGRELGALLRVLPEWTLAGYFDDAIPAGTSIGGHKVVGSSEQLLKADKPVHLLLAIGDPAVKLSVFKRISINKFITFPVVIHPTAVFYDRDSIQLGSGTVVSAGCVLTADIRIGEQVLLNLNTSIGHHSEIDSFSSLMPGVNLAGNIKVGKAVLIGSGAQLINEVRVGDGSKVGAGAVVTKHVREGTTVVGVPAKALD